MNKKRIKNILLTILIVESIIYLIISLVIIARNDKKLIDNKIKIQDLEYRLNELEIENISIKLQNQDLWELYYNNVKEYNGEYYE